MSKPGSWFLLAKCLKNKCGRVTFLKKDAGRWLSKDAGLRPGTLLIKGLWHRCFSVNFAKFLGAFFTEHLGATRSGGHSLKVRHNQLLEQSYKTPVPARIEAWIPCMLKN